MAEAAVPARYPVRLDVEYAEAQSRWKALLRPPLSVPVLIFIYLLQSGSILAIWAAILVRGRIPRWLFDFQVAVNRFGLRTLGYLLLLTDQYPPFEGVYPLRYEVEYPQRVSRWRLVFWKILTAVPHLFVLWLLQIAAGVAVIIAWFAILLAGRSPRGLHQFVAGVLRWGARVQAYVLSLTDEFPPFSIDADAGGASRRSYVLSAGAGVLATAAAIGGSLSCLPWSQTNRSTSSRRSPMTASSQARWRPARDAPSSTPASSISSAPPIRATSSTRSWTLLPVRGSSSLS